MLSMTGKQLEIDDDRYESVVTHTWFQMSTVFATELYLRLFMYFWTP